MKSILKLLKVALLFLLMLMVASCGGKEERKAKYLEKGKTYLLEKNYEKARIEFKNALQIDPKFAEAYFYVGKLEEDRKELKKAVGNYRKAIELNKDYAEAKIRLAKIYVITSSDQLISEAKVLLKEAKAVNPNDLEIDLVLATIELKTGDQSKAVADIEALVKKDLSLVEGVSILSTVYLSEKNFTKAEKILVDGVGHNKGDVYLRMSLAKLYARNKKYDLAEKYLKEVVNIEPERFNLKVAMAIFYANSNQLMKAEQVLRQAIKDDEDDVQRYVSLVELLSSKVNLEKAMAELKAFIQQKPELYELQFVMAGMYQRAGKVSDAKDVLSEIIAEKSYDPEGVKARNALAVILLSEGDVEGAKKYVDQVIAEHPSNNDALLTNGKLSLMAADAVSAINDLRTVVKNEPKNAEASLLLAKAHELNNESSLAEDVLKRSIEANPIDYNVHVNYANYLAQKNRMNSALNIVERALSYFKDNYELLDLKLKLVAGNGDENKVLAILDEMKHVSPEKAETYIKKGQYYLSKKQFDMAIDEFEQALVKTSNKYAVLDKITRAYFSNNQKDKAIERLNKYLNENKNNAASQQLLGQVYLSDKDYIKARSYFRQALSNANNWDVPYKSLAASYLIEQNFSEAIKIYKQAIPLVSNKVSMLLKLAGVYEENKNYKEAFSVYDKILSINSNNKLAANNLASLLLDHGTEQDIQKALDLVKDFDKIKQPALQDTLGWAYAKSGNNQKAIEILSAVVKQSPKVAVFQYHLGSALFNNGEKDKAKPYLQMSVDSKQAFFGKDDAKKLLSTY